MQSATAPSRTTAASARYLCVDLLSEQYAIEILHVREIQAYAAPTPVPRMPPHVRGVTNLHGDIVPIVDLRLRLGMPEQPYGRLTVTVFVGVGEQVVGLLVDAASRVLDITAAQIQPPPKLAGGVDLSFIAGIARPGDRVIVILDVAALLGRDPALAAAGHAPTAVLKEGM